MNDTQRVIRNSYSCQSLEYLNSFLLTLTFTNSNKKLKSDFEQELIIKSRIKFIFIYLFSK